MQREKFKRELSAVLEYAKAKIASGNEPPWAWYQYMKLIETCEAILESMKGVHLLNEDASEVKVNVPM
jgi:hypothetical protein